MSGKKIAAILHLFPQHVLKRRVAADVARLRHGDGHLPHVAGAAAVVLLLRDGVVRVVPGLPLLEEDDGGVRVLHHALHHHLAGVDVEVVAHHI